MLFLSSAFIGARVEWLNHASGSQLPIWRGGGEEGFDRTKKLRSSPYANDLFWENADKLVPGEERLSIQQQAKNWNTLLEFGRPWALLQFPLLVVLVVLLWISRKRWKPLQWWALLACAFVFLSIAVYRDYSYGMYGI